MANDFRNIDGYFDQINTRVQKKTVRALKEAAIFAAKMMDSAFDDEGERGGDSSTRWERTSRAALMARKTYPKSGGKTGKKGFTKAQAGFLFKAPTLVDTGAMMKSISIESILKPNDIRFFIGAGVKYVQTAEEGGSITVKGKSYDVPARPFQFLTLDEVDSVGNIIGKELSNA